MTTPSQQPIPPLAPLVLANEDEQTPEERVTRDADGTPVGKDDQRADVERSGGDPDSV